MRQIDMIALKSAVKGRLFNISAEEYWNPVVKLRDAKIVVNCNDNYLIAYNKNFEFHINCVLHIYEDDGSFIARKKGLNNDSDIESYRITPNN